MFVPNNLLTRSALLLNVLTHVQMDTLEMMKQEHVKNVQLVVLSVNQQKNVSNVMMVILILKEYVLNHVLKDIHQLFSNVHHVFKILVLNVHQEILKNVLNVMIIFIMEYVKVNAQKELMLIY